MSDKERVRYLPHRAETKNKKKKTKGTINSNFHEEEIKKEQAFTLLNLAKTNQNWRQIMRKMKAKDMKNELEYLKTWIERLMEKKNNRIAKLSLHLDSIIEHQNDHIVNLQAEYREELNGLIDQARVLKKMAGKKKKSLANKLAKMSDEDRARYLQHRAEMEEEAKRRKEQLIAIFMKKKIKKEEAFARLNLAKINQNWHQIMRKMKVKEMKNEVEYLQTWIERLMEKKNNRIAKLMDELEDAEEQYMNNFNSHSLQLDSIIEHQNDHIENLQTEYREELNGLIDQARKEEDLIRNHSNAEVLYLKTVTFGQETLARKQLKDTWETYSKRLYEVEYNNRTSLKLLCKTRAQTESALWRQILDVVSLYVQRTDIRRSHLLELRRMDAESSDEIQRNEMRIMKDEELIKTLTLKYEDLQKMQSDKLKSLQAEETLLKTNFLKIRRCLKLHLDLDQKQLRHLTSTSNEVLDYLTGLLNRGRHLLALSGTCQKFTTDRERVSRWLPVIDFAPFRGGLEMACDGLTDDQKLYEKVLQEELMLKKIREDFSTTDEAAIKPARASSSIFPIWPAATSDKSGSNFLPKIESKMAPIKDVKIDIKENDFDDQQKRSSAEGAGIKIHFLDKCYESLEKMENFWTVHNKVEIDFRQLVQEKTALEKENKQLRGFIRAVLEAAALAKVPPDSKVSTRVPSKRRSAYSAPMQKITF